MYDRRAKADQEMNVNETEKELSAKVYQSLTVPLSACLSSQSVGALRDGYPFP